MSRNLINKARNSYYAKDKVSVDLCSELEDKNSLYVDKNNKIAPSTYTPFVEQQKDIDRSLTLYSLLKVHLSCYMHTLLL